MKKIICGVEYDTEASQLIKRYTEGHFGEADGFEESLYKTDGGKYFLYTNGGGESRYRTESIKRMSTAAAEKWLSEH